MKSLLQKNPQNLLLPGFSCRVYTPWHQESPYSIINHSKAVRQTNTRAQSSTEEGVGVSEPRRITKTRGTCYGCGASLQIINADAAGYIEQNVYQEKLIHKQLNQLLCGRCRGLSHGQMIPAVEDKWAIKQQYRSNNRRLVTPKQLREQLLIIREKAAVVVLLVDLLDASGSFLSKLRDLTGRNPIVLIGTKVDLLPKGTDELAVRAWLAEMAAAKQLNVIHTCLVSSRSRAGVSEATAFLRQNRMGRDIYIVGAANVGKSAFSRALVEDMSNALTRQFDPASALAVRRLPVQSAMPGTTLQLITLQAFQSGGSLIDTPGVHLEHRLVHILTPGEAKDLHPRGRLKPHVAPGPQLQPSADSPNPRQSTYFAAYLWGGLVRIELVSSSETSRLVFLGTPKLLVTSLFLSNQAAAPSLDSSASFGADSVAAQGGLRLVRQANLQGNRLLSATADVAISGLPGWITLYSADNAKIQLKIYAPVGIEAYVRPPIPCHNPLIKE